jgi:uncharacterized protein
MIAEPADQLRLLDLQALDSKLSQLAHRRRTLPQLAEAAALDTRLSQLHDVLVACAADESDLAREQAKAEADVDQVRARAARDRKILDAGAAAPKELSGLQSELESLARRQSDLEDVVLDVMERTESADARSSGLRQQQAAAQSERDRIGAALGAEQAAIDKDVEFATQQRSVIAGQIPADLLALYVKIRDQYDGVGAAEIRQRRCEGCRLELDVAEMNSIKAAPPDAVLRHDTCRRILVRTAGSGL